MSSITQYKKEYEIKIKGLGSLTKLLSPYFNLTRKESQVLAALIHLINESDIKVVTKELKQELANMSNFKMQVVTNYINIFRKAGVLRKDDSLHPILNANKIIINYE